MIGVMLALWMVVEVTAVSVLGLEEELPQQ